MGLILRMVHWFEVIIRVVGQELLKSKQNITEFTESSEVSGAHTYVVAPTFMAVRVSLPVLIVFDKCIAHLSSSFSLFQ